MLVNLSGALSVIGSIGLIAYALHITESADCLWAIILVIILAANFPWQKNAKSPKPKEVE